MQVDHSLTVQPFVASTEKQPINTHYQSYESTSSTETSVRFNVDTPFAGALLDNEVYIEYKCQINSTDVAYLPGLFEGYNAGAATVNAEAGPVPAPQNLGRLALRQGFAVHNALESINLKLNGQSITQRPQIWMPEFTRFFASQEELSSICSMSGGELDCGSFGPILKDDATASREQFTQATGVVTNLQTALGYTYPYEVGGGGANTVNTVAALPTGSDRWYNEGFTKRAYRLAYNSRLDTTASAADAAPASNASRYGVSISFSVWERVPVSPFMLWEAKDGKRSIPYIDKMELQLRFSSNPALTLQGLNDLAGGNTLSFLKAAESPVLHLKWYIPPAGFVMEPERSIHVSLYEELPKTAFDVAIADADKSSGTLTTRYNNIRLQQIPDLMFVFLKPEESVNNSRIIDPSEKHLEIESIKVTVNGDSGKLENASSGELFAMYCRNSPMAKHRKYEYDEWRRKYCTVALKPRDLGVKFGPGINHGVTLDVEVKAKSWWNLPAVGRALSLNFEGVPGVASTSYEMHIVCCYERYELTMTNRGNASLKLLNVPSPVRDPGLGQPDSLDLRRALG